MKKKILMYYKKINVKDLKHKRELIIHTINRGMKIGEDWFYMFNILALGENIKKMSYYL